MKTIIIAAGQGSRLWETTDRVPKTLLPLGDGTVLSRIVANFAAVGVDEFVLVVGFNREHIVEYLERNESLRQAVHDRGEPGVGAGERDLGAARAGRRWRKARPRSSPCPTIW